MEYAVYNLLTNAVKYSPPHTRVTVSGEDGKGDRVRLSIADEGIGMDKTEVEPDFREVLSDKKSGTIGRDGYRNRPFHRGADCYAPRRRDPGGLGTGKRIEIHAGVETRSMSEQILLVEDDSSVRTTIVTCLEMEGFGVDAVSNTRDALDRLAANGYPLVISDIYIDDRTGLDVLAEAKRRNPGCAVILMTARGTMETVMAATRNGAFDYLAKPFELDTLIESVRRAINARTTDDDEEAEPEELPETEMIGSSAGDGRYL